MPAGRALSMAQRLDLCVEIGSAVISMHANNLKTENVLMFRDEKEVYCAKVSDFGYFTRFLKPDEVCPMPRSQPWDAPEHHFNMFTINRCTKYGYILPRSGLLLLDPFREASCSGGPTTSKPRMGRRRACLKEKFRLQQGVHE
ncbi:hypothetical protein J3E72DRAFT_268989 [Bipolaris maydis]|nr:hypothetical protein J3E72DRAFT_268989 [Bipolaris maydis]